MLQTFILLLCVHSIVGLVKINVAKIPSTTESNIISSTDAPTTISTSIATTITTPTTSEKSTTVATSTTEAMMFTTKLIPMRNGTNETTSINTTITNTTIPIDRSKLHDYYCKCDLTVDECDINCCCDIDCTNEMMRSFNCIDSLYNQYDYNMEQGLPSCRVSNNLFCVLDEKKKPGDEIIMVFQESMKSQIAYTWPDVFVEEKVVDDRDYYRYNDPILAFNEETEEIEEFKLPYSLTGDHCQVSNSIKFLKNFATKCHYNAENLPTLIESLQMKKILKIPNYREKNKNFNSMEHCTGANCDCIEFQFFNCNYTADECTAWINETTTSSPVNPDDFYSIEKLTINFQHNYTNLISGKINFHFNNNNPNNINSNLLLLNYKINFNLIGNANDEKKLNASKKLSGNYGYRMGYPIIISELNNTVIKYFNSSSNSNISSNTTSGKNEYSDYISLPKVIKNRICSMDAFQKESINFGANRIGKCFIKILNNYTITNSSSSNSNNTSICINIQQLIYNYLLNNFNYRTSNGTIHLAVSKFGKPRDNLKHWLNLKLINNYNLNEITSNNVGNSELVCSNIQLNVKWKFYYNKLMDNSYKEFVVNYVELEFGKRLNLNFNLNERHFMIPLYYDVIFYQLKFNYTERVLYNFILIVLCMLLIISCN